MSAPEQRQAVEGAPTPRQPGWTLVATREGPQGWHRITDTVGRYGSVRTACGQIGRPINENLRAIIYCSACQKAAGPTS